MAKSTNGTGRPVTAGVATEAPDASIAASRRIGTLIAAVGALLMIGGVFLPWLSYSGSSRLSGWGVYQNHVNAGGNGFVITRMFTPEATSILFTGFTILIAGVLAGMAVLWVLGLARTSRLGMRRLGGHVAFPAMQLASLTLGLCIINLVMVLTGDHSEPVGAGPGLYVTAAGALVLCMGMFMAVRTRRSEITQLGPVT